MTCVRSTPSSYNTILFIASSYKYCTYLIIILLNISFSTDAFVADDDTLVISGGLYDGHPIYDNVPTASADESQFHLEFLH